MKTSNSGRILMTPGVTVAPFSEAMPLHPQNGDEVIAVNVGSSTYTLTGSITDGNLVMDAGESAILVWVGSTWKATWSSGSGGVTYPITATRGGTGADNSGAADEDILIFDIGSGTFVSAAASTLGVIATPISADLGGTGADLSALDAGQLIAFDGSVFAGVGLAAVSTAPGDTATSTLFWSATDSGANTSNVSAGIELPNSVGVAGDWVLRTGGTGADGSGTELLRGWGNSVPFAVPVLQVAESSLLFMGTADPVTDFPTAAILNVKVGGGNFIAANFMDAAYTLTGYSSVNIISDPTNTGQPLMVAQSADIFDGIYANPDGVLNVGVSNTSDNPIAANFVNSDTTGVSDFIQLAFKSSESESVSAGGTFEFQNSGEGNGRAWFGFNFDPDHNNVDVFRVIGKGVTTEGGVDTTLLGLPASALIGSGTDGTVNLVADAPGIAGNGYTVEVVEAAGANDNSSASFTLQALTVTLGKTAGVLDPAKNTATIIAGLINTEAGGVTATASGTGADPLTGAEGPTTFTGGAESLTLAGGAQIGNTLYGSSLAGSSAIFQTSATDGSNLFPTLVARANTSQASPVFQAQFTDGTPSVNIFGTGIIGDAGFFSVRANTFGFFGSDDPATDFATFGPGPLNVLAPPETANAAFFQNLDTTGDLDYIQLHFKSFESESISALGIFEFQNSGNGDGASWFGMNFTADENADVFRFHSDGSFDTSGLGSAALASIGSGTDGTVRLVADAVGVVGNGFTVQVVVDAGASAPMTAAFTDHALLVTLGTDGGGVPDPTKNTATLVAAAINGEAGGVTATASGTGADPISATSGPTNFTGGAESLTLAGGFSAAGANIYLTNLPASDPGIPGALYRTLGAVMVSL